MCGVTGDTFRRDWTRGNRPHSAYEPRYWETRASVSRGRGVNDTCTRHTYRSDEDSERKEGKEEPEEERKHKKRSRKNSWRGRSRIRSNVRPHAYLNTTKTPDLNLIEALGHLWEPKDRGKVEPALLQAVKGHGASQETNRTVEEEIQPCIARWWNRETETLRPRRPELDSRIKVEDRPSVCSSA